MRALAVITARGGSKRIPKKNIRDFLGRPIIAYVIDAALKSGLFDEVMVSTDSQEIADIALKYGAKVPFMRSEKTSGDFSTTADVLLEVLEQYAGNKQEFETLCCLYPTAPFVTAERLREAIEKFRQENAPALIPVVPFCAPIQRAFKIEEGVLAYAEPAHERTRSQDLPPRYYDAGQFCLIRTAVLRERKSMVPPGTVPFILAEEEVQDIDTENDWRMAEFKYSYFKR